MSESELPRLDYVNVVGISAETSVLLGEAIEVPDDDLPEVSVHAMEMTSPNSDEEAFGVKLGIAHATTDMRISIEAVAKYSGQLPDLNTDYMIEVLNSSALPALFPYVYEAFNNTAARLPGARPQIPASRPTANAD